MGSVSRSEIDFFAALYSPYFLRELNCWWIMKDWRADMPQSDFVDQTGYCLDAVDSPTRNGIF